MRPIDILCSWYDAVRKSQGHFCGIFAKYLQPQPESRDFIRLTRIEGLREKQLANLLQSDVKPEGLSLVGGDGEDMSSHGNVRSPISPQIECEWEKR